jgi:5-methylcytosine-specific restriction endonuclease McrA
MGHLVKFFYPVFMKEKTKRVDKNGIPILPGRPPGMSNRKIIFNKTNGKCFYCGKQLQMKNSAYKDYMTVDHAFPLSKGGFKNYS